MDANGLAVVDMNKICCVVGFLYFLKYLEIQKTERKHENDRGTIRNSQFFPSAIEPFSPNFVSKTSSSSRS